MGKKSYRLLVLILSFASAVSLSACAPSSSSSGIADASTAGYTCPAVKPPMQVALQSEGKATLSENYDHYIVQLSDKLNPAGLSPSGRPLREYQVAGLTLQNLSGSTFALKLPGSLEEKRQALQALSQSENIDYVEPDYPISVEQDSENYSQDLMSQWAHQAVDSLDAWKVTQGNHNIVVAIVDSGIDYTHRDLQGNIWNNPGEIPGNGIDDDRNGFVDDVYGWNFAENNNRPMTTSRSNHGTHVAGIVGATGKTANGVIGETPNVKLMALRFIGEAGSGMTSAAIRAIDYAVSKKVFAINNSWGSNLRSKALDAAITRAEKAGILFVVAAGNGSQGLGFDIGKSPWYPAGYSQSNILNVAATSQSDLLTKFSNFGLSMVDVAAPGYNILSTVTGNKYQKMSGTSMAAPLVTGLAVLVKAANPALRYDQIKKIISMSVDTVSSLIGKLSSGGRVNAARAVALAKAPNLEAVLDSCP